MATFQSTENYKFSGLAVLSIRMVIGWTYFSALWRRFVLADKLDPQGAGYIGEKFNHFLPQALGIKPIIEFLVTHPDTLWWAMLIFTIVEGIVGLFLIFGLFSRLMSVGVFGLALGILLGSGWLGTTCLDEWQIGVLGISSGFTLFITGSGYFSMDKFLIDKNYAFTSRNWFRWIASGPFPVNISKRSVIITGLLLLLFTLFTNQYFHGGVYGTLHNKSVSPELEIYQPEIKDDQLTFSLMRTQGVDVYGSYLIKVEVLDDDAEVIWQRKAKDLATMKDEQITNEYVAEVKTGKHSLVIPLGAKAELNFPIEWIGDPDDLQLKLTDISGKTWTASIQ